MFDPLEKKKRAPILIETPAQKQAYVQAEQQAQQIFDTQQVEVVSHTPVVVDGQQATPTDSILVKKTFIEANIINGHSLFIGLKNILPEDILWRKDHPKVPAMVCLQQNNACDCPFNCMTKFAQRVRWLFDQYPEVTQIFVLLQRDEPNLLRKKPPMHQMLDMPHKEVLTSVPRILTIHIPRDFKLRMFRVNYDGLQLDLQQSTRLHISVPFDFFN